MIKEELSIFLPRNFFHIYLYNKHHRPWIYSLKNAITYDGKIHYLMAMFYDESFGVYADKYAVREYVKNSGLSHLLVPILGMWNTPSEIDFKSLPSAYILKTTHGSGPQFYEIKHKENVTDTSKILAKLENAMRINFATYAAQYHYRGIKPRIIAEKLLEDDKETMLDDYKVVCSYGKAKAILVCTGRDKGRDYYSPEWKYLDYVKDEYKSGKIIEKPVVLDEMLHAAEVLSKPFPLSRIDFYIVDERLYFGEITLTPSAGNHVNLTEYGQLELGRMITI